MDKIQRKEQRYILTSIAGRTTLESDRGYGWARIDETDERFENALTHQEFTEYLVKGEENKAVLVYLNRAA